MAEKQSIKRFIVRDPHGHIEQEDSFSVVGEVHVDIVPGYGEPYADSEYVNGILTITIHNIEGNGITEITTDSQEGDEAVNTVTIKTNDNPEGVVLEVRNGSRGNGIASSSEVLSPEDGGTNTHTITDTDGNEHVFHTKNGQTGRKGDQGDSAVYDPSSPDAPDFVMANTTGQSTTKAMTQKATTDAVNTKAKKSYFTEAASGSWVGEWGTMNTTTGEISSSTTRRYKIMDLSSKLYDKLSFYVNTNTTFGFILDDDSFINLTLDYSSGNTIAIDVPDNAKEFRISWQSNMVGSTLGYNCVKYKDYTKDGTPTSGSNHYVESGGVYTAISNAVSGVQASIDSTSAIEPNTDIETECSFTLVNGYWGTSGITASAGFYCTSELISVKPGTIVKVKNFFKSSTPASSAAAYLYNKNRLAVGNRLNIQDFTLQSDGSYTYYVENANAAFIGLDTQDGNSNGTIKIIWPTKIKDIFKKQLLLEPNARIEAIEDALNVHDNHVDLIMFMGQSNMAGRGITNSSHPVAAPTVIDGAGYEFRPISDPTKLYPIAEPFGKNENKSGGIDDGSMKTGSMVAAFVNAYYKTTGKVIVGVSASKGGTTSANWQPSGTLLPDAVQRFSDAVDFLTTNGYTIDHKYMVWCQGESDGDANVSANTYKLNFRTILDTMENSGIEKCFIVRIGKYNGESSVDYTTIINAQSELCKDNADIVMASTALASFKDKGLMKDSFHYYQDAYNIVGTLAGRNVGLYRLYGIGKPQYDVMTDSLFFTSKDY